MRKDFVAVAVLLVTLTVTVSTHPASPCGVLNRNGRVLDGSGHSWIAER